MNESKYLLSCIEDEVTAIWREIISNIDFFRKYPYNFCAINIKILFHPSRIKIERKSKQYKKCRTIKRSLLILVNFKSRFISRLCLSFSGSFISLFPKALLYIKDIEHSRFHPQDTEMFSILHLYGNRLLVWKTFHSTQ